MPDDNSTPFHLLNPVSTGFFVTDPFNSPRPYANGRHEGIDLRAVSGGKPAEIAAAQRGTIDRIHKGDTNYGNYVCIRHEWDDGTTWITWYAHLATVNPALEEGETVDVGRYLGIAGDTGNATGVHLHLTLQHLGHGLGGYVIPDVVNPLDYFNVGSPASYEELTCLADITMPAGATILAGKPFTKSWLVRNSGTVAWNRCTVEHFGDELMDGPANVPLPALKPGEVGEVSIPLVAPAIPGRHRSTWKPRNARGRLFGFELVVDIVVSPVDRRDDAVFIAHVTLPSAEKVEVNRTYVKTWRVRNTGSSTWGKGYSLRPADGFQSEPTYMALPAIKPGAKADLSLPITTPAKPGTYRSSWKLCNTEGLAFGPVLSVDLAIESTSRRSTDDATLVDNLPISASSRFPAGATFTKTWRIRNSGKSAWGDGYVLAPAGNYTIGKRSTVTLPQIEPNQEGDVSVELTAPAIPGRHRATWQARAANGTPFGDILHVEIEVIRNGSLDHATFVSDVTIPDGEVVEAGKQINKKWRVRNTGSTTWGAGYSVIFAADNKMNGPDSVPLPPAFPGETAEIAVTLQSPLAPGIHRSTWRPSNPDGSLFGDLLFAEIRVPVSSIPGSSAQEDAQLEAHITIPDGSEIRPGATFEKTWAVRNTGSIPWSAGYELAFVGGTQMGPVQRVAVGDVPSQSVVNLTINMTAPLEIGRHISRWRMRNRLGEFFGSTLFASIVVVESPTKFDMLSYLRGDGRLYEMKHIFEMPNGPLIGQQRVQTQFEGIRFYQTKNSEWEEMWSDDRFIYRGTDTSPGSGNFYTLMDGERYGSAWIPRHMAVGQAYRRSVVVVSRRKGNCVMNSHLSGRHITWIRLEAIHNQFALPDVEGRPGQGYKARDVAVFAAFNEVNGRPAERPFERYYYAKGFGLIMWEGIDTDHRGISFLVQVHKPGDRPDNIREKIPCLDSIRP